MRQRATDGVPGRDRVHAAEDGFSGLMPGTVAVGDGGHGDRRIDVMDDLRGGRDFGRTEVAGVITLRGDVGLFDAVEVEQ